MRRPASTPARTTRHHRSGSPDPSPVRAHRRASRLAIEISARQRPAMVPPPAARYNVLGVGVSALTLSGTRDAILGVRGTLRRGYICLGTAYGLVEALADPELREAYNRSWLTTPDGMPLVWLGRREMNRRNAGRTAGSGRGAFAAPTAAVERVYGPDLMLEVCNAGRAAGLTHYLYGGAPGVAEQLREQLVGRFPGLRVIGTYAPPFRPLTREEFVLLQDDVARARPDVMWIGLGTPKQERFMAGAWGELDAGVMIGVGAAFDFHAGRVRQAPRWIQRSGFEWFFRLCTEPGRLGRRYLTTTPLFALHVVAQLSGLRNYDARRE
jgi:N-acetylglucosaminyldiphosphoundecaprenol N-acetyl-beta-D-mannosaminyltransferase